MKKTAKLFIGLTLTVATIVACKKHEVIDAPVTTPPQELTELNKQYLESKRQTFTVNADVYNTILGNQGTQITLSGNNFEDANGNPLTGMVDIELIELYSLSEMIAANKVTLAEENGQIIPLTSGGEFYISVTQNGNPVTVVNALSMRTAAVPNTVNNMQLFNGNLDAQGNILWTLDNNATLPTDTAGWRYLFDWNGAYNWVNCDYFFSFNNQQTNVTVEVPGYCEEENTIVYLAMPDETALTSLSHTSGNEYTTGPNYTLPEGLNLLTVVVTVHDNQIKYSIQQSTIGTNHHVNVTSMTVAPSLEELELIIQSYL